MRESCIKVIKKFPALTLIFIILLNSLSVFADNETSHDEYINTLVHYNIIDRDFLQRDYVNRLDCVIAIMKTIGFPENAARKYENAFYERPIFRDLDFYRVKDAGYVLAAKVCKIAYGDEVCSYIRNFYPYSNVTLKECAAFMMRCLEENTIYLDDTYKYAIDTGLLQEDDDFEEKENEYISPEFFCKMLNRLLYSKRGLYFHQNTIYFGGIESSFDIDSNIRYIDQFENTNTEDTYFDNIEE